MIVVSDAGSLHYLIAIEKIEILQTLFGKVVLPQSVCEELGHPAAPVEVRKWFESLPSWAGVGQSDFRERPLPLGNGEAEAIRLAQDLKAELILSDDKKARRIAEAQGLVATDTLGILLIAHRRGLARMPETLDELIGSGYRLSDKLAKRILAASNDPSDSTEKDC